MVKHDEHIEYDDRGTLAQVSRRLLPIVIFLGAMGFYLKTMAPSIFWGDSAAFATTNYILGIPPSPSFPLYTLIGRLFAAVPGMTAAFAANLMSVFFAALSVTVFFMLARQLMDVPALTARDYQKIMDGKKLLFRRPDLKRAGKMLDLERATQPPALVALACFALTALFAVSLPVWLSAVRAEVYSLHLFMTLLAVYLCAKGHVERSENLFLGGFWVYALSFANHPFLALIMAPPFVLIFILHVREVRSKPAFVTAAALFLIIAFSVYTYLPLRGALDPSVNWGRPDNMASFWTAVSGSVNMTDVASLKASDYWLRFLNLGKFIGAQIGWLTLALVPLGFWGLYKVSRRFSWFFVLAILSNLVLLIWTAEFSARNADMVSFMAPLLAILLLVGVAGSLYQLRRYIVARNAAVYFSVFLGIMIYFAGSHNIARADLSQVHAPDILCDEILKDIPDNSLLIVADDGLMLPLWYYTYADSTINNVKIISAGALSLPAYRKRLTQVYPDLNYPDGFNNTNGVNADQLPGLLCDLNLNRGDVYVQYGVAGITFDHLQPHGVVFQYLNHQYEGKPDGELSARYINLANRMLEGNPKEIGTIDFVSRWLFNMSVYFNRSGTPGLAWDLMRTALEIDTDNIEMRLALSRALAKGGRYKESLKYISEVLDIDPYHPEARQLGHDIAEKINPTTAATPGE